MIEGPYVGITVLLSPQGIIEQVFNAGSSIELKIGKTITKSVCPKSREGMEAILSKVRQDATVHNQRIYFSLADKSLPMYITAFRLDDKLLFQLSEVADNDDVLPTWQALYEQYSKLNNQLVSAQRELYRANFELSKLNKFKSEFMGMIVHDLRNPMLVIGGYLEILLDSAESLEDEQRHLLIGSLTLVNEMSQLLENLLDINRLEQGVGKINLEKFDLVPLIRDRIEVRQCAGKTKHARFCLDLAGDRCMVYADKTKVKMVIDLVLGNAMRWSSSQSTISVSLQEEVNRVRVVVSSFSASNAESNQKNSLRDIHCATSVAKEEAKSKSLRLAIARKLIEEHHQTFGINQGINKESIVFFYLDKG